MSAPPSFRPPAVWLDPPSAPVGVAEMLEAALQPDGTRPGQAPVPAAVCRLLAARGVRTVDEAKRFLRPTLEHVEAPCAMADLARAAGRLAAAVRAGETILVHGDYDVDGMCSTALMTRTLRAVGGSVVPFIPNRLTDGYDLGPAGVRAAVEHKARVVLTCDCGTTAHAAAEELATLGIDLIISDHHLPGGPLPRAYAVINPKRSDCESIDKDLAAVGVAYKLAMEVTRLLGGDEDVVRSQLELVALATVADVAPLRGENRVFVRLGLQSMARPSGNGTHATNGSSADPSLHAGIPRGANLGLRALVRSARLDGKPLSAGRLGFTIAPRLNALGRLADALKGVELLLAPDESAANRIARECEELNEKRQEQDRRILAEAMQRVAAMDMRKTHAIVLDGHDWHPGVIGIVASRVVEQTGRPTFMIAVDEHGIGKGSGRSIGRFDLHAALQACTDLLIKHGGHKAAAGLTIDATRLPEFTERFNRIAAESLTEADFAPQLRTDLELPLDEATEQLERSLRHMEPFGVGNPGPVLVSRGVRVKGNPRRIGTDGLKFTLESPGCSLAAIGWGLAPRAAELPDGAVLDIAYKLDVNEYRGARTLQAVIQDFRAAPQPVGSIGVAEAVSRAHV